MATPNTTTLATLATALVLTVAGCHTPAGNATTPTAPSTGGPDIGAARAALAGLTVAPEDTGAHYKREDWLPRWATVRGACDTRETALQQQGKDVRTDGRCKAISGTWVSPYDPPNQATITKAASTDLDHLVPLAEAARSGTRGWSKTQREAFANDLTQLVVVSAKSNRSKGDQDPARWLPTAGYRCTYAARYVLTKAKYRLAVDKAEHDVLAGLLSKCAPAR
ncbi:HNH endonuclease family protein [Amycolatopsis sp. CA-230715]|uniref:HNH endonuclease family protein n=1 Tax=Amycolatopsis sp. CA-230715 TaxID=2745196 RepID=UPI001C010262|nr:HNH endonuclease family protein [Amycolatopsis sp. CA-230715]QWF80460.1 hypothetical protein HUW46_03882 [Amycolatopsis sp. CA-230715]